ncbi:rhomboid family intramembrane serine protease [Pseudorhodoplanes sp.]|uniref:rhomboid family intramembrane serine protease n=1 Tax=Pseudorhodoplanes sp. TaxID=1934341 RepID=UPI002C583624|nr:rhomboid family intramembrane serine protease [Pseudorhodoplanes sp.]HWV40115.1 rhomboid family intramembrane serine protease [Pseudorhodoplanes sp.]
MDKPSDRPREPILNVPPVIVALLLVLGGVHAVRVWLLPDDIDRMLVWTLAFVPARYDTSVLIDGMLPGGWGAEIWTFVTYALLHADLTHIGFNAIWLLAFASPVARRFGTRRFLVFFAVTVVAGAVAYLVVHPGELAPMIGASAGISGTMGASARFVFEPGGSLDMRRGDRSHADQVPAAPLGVALRNPRVVAFVAVWFGLNLLFGLGSLSFVEGDQAIAWEAHLGGFLAGLLLFSMFDPTKPPPPAEPERDEPPATDWLPPDRPTFH